MRSNDIAFIEMVEDSVVKGLRSGQSHWIAGVVIFPSLNFNEILGGNADCFYNDENIPTFLDWLDKQP